MLPALHGFVDLQVNGWMGADFTAPGLTVGRVREIARELADRGTWAFCPTLITGDPAVYDENLRVLAEAMDDPVAGPHLLGIHLEGPFLSPEPGAVGVHPPAFVRDPDIAFFERLREASRGRIRLLTLAPERPGALDLIRHAARAGVVVSLGHHLAPDAVLDEAVRAGALACTHVGNGCPNQVHRHRNPIWWQLASDRVAGLFIPDGHHLPDAFLKVALRAKTPARFIATSDASALAGLPPGRYTVFHGLPVVIEPNGRIFAESTQSLAGSHATLLECMNHLAGLDLLDEPALRQVGALNPLRLLGLGPDRLDAARGRPVRFQDGRFHLG